MRKALVVAIVIVIAAAAGFLAYSWHPEIPAVARTSPDQFDKALVARGAELSSLGNCQSCHTRPRGPAFAGGREFATPFGEIYSTNISPDPDTGIGNWSEDAFRRALHEGVSRSGSHLYPVFPYDHFTLVSGEDVKAIYAYLMTRAPVRAEPAQNRLRFPLGFRPLLAGWKLLNFTPGRFQPAAGASEDEQAGAYLVQGLTHCGSCHTPRNLTGGKRGRELSGGEVEHWYAPALNANASSPTPWSTEQIETYLRVGFVENHGVAAGPMRDVVENIGAVDPRHARAIAAFIGKTLVPGTSTRPDAKDLLVSATAPSFWQTSAGNQTEAKTLAANDGAMLYAGACAMCHEPTGLRFSARGIPLQLSKVVAMPDPRNIIHLIVEGIEPAPTARFARMPGFASSLDDRQIASLAAYVRSRFSRGPAWQGLESHAATIRGEYMRMHR